MALEGECEQTNGAGDGRVARRDERDGGGVGPEADRGGGDGG